MLPAKEKPLITVGVVICNEYRCTVETIDSLRAKDCANLEIVICDNCSTDGSARVCKAATEPDKRIRCIRHETNGEAPANSVFSLDQALHGEFIHVRDISCRRRQPRVVDSDTEKLKRFNSGKFGMAVRWFDRIPPLLRLPVEQARSVLRSDLSWIHRVAVLMAFFPAVLARYLVGRPQ